MKYSACEVPLPLHAIDKTWRDCRVSCISVFYFQALAPYGMGVATGEACQNRVVFKQFLQAGALQFAQIDSCRMAGPNEILAVYLMAKKLGSKYKRS